MGSCAGRVKDGGLTVVAAKLTRLPIQAVASTPCAPANGDFSLMYNHTRAGGRR